MIRHIGRILLVFALLGYVAGCAENEHKVTTKHESKTESEPRDVSPGEMVVE